MEKVAQSCFSPTRNPTCKIDLYIRWLCKSTLVRMVNEVTASWFASGCTSELKPRVISMKKKRMAHSGATGICVKPSGYTTNTSPGPTHVQQNPSAVVDTCTTDFPVKCTCMRISICSNVTFAYLDNKATICCKTILRTRLCYLVHGHAFLLSHKAEHTEDDEAGVEARAAVDERYQQGVSVSSITELGSAVLFSHT